MIKTILCTFLKSAHDSNKGGVNMPRGKELEQLPMSNIAPGMGEDKGKFNRESLTGIIGDEGPEPSKVDNQKEEQS